MKKIISLFLMFLIFSQVLFCKTDEEKGTSMLIKKEEARVKTKTPNCTIWEFLFPTPNLGLATAKINGRYPEENKKAVNTQCDIIYFVISGQGTIHHETGNYKITKGDAFLFEKGKWYWVEGEDLIIVLPNSPAWFPEQYKEIE